MRRREREKQLHQIAAIRALQSVTAEAEAIRASADLREKNAKKEECERALRNAEENWQSVLSAPSLAPEMIPLWSASLLSEDEELRRASRETALAASKVGRASAQWHAAIARRDKAKDLARAATKDRQRRREELALQNASDRHAQLWGGR